MAITGHGATLTWADFSGPLINLNIGEFTRPKRNTTHLGTTGFATTAPGDLVEAGEISGDFYFVPGNEPTFSDAVTGTLTFSDGGTMTGTVYLVSWGGVEVATNESMVGSLTFAFDCETGPTITAAAS
ncbi:MAG TPA: hypothetical protein VGN57_10045 [Pirellulaceae bacterium]|jgi:hypothetical protein|nr:hypothetical protein [Pirellulaceae bacterium]